MSLDPDTIAERISLETGLPFRASSGRDAENHRWIELVPIGHERSQSFALRTAIGWRELRLSFVPGSFAADLVEAMFSADPNGRSVFVSVLDECRKDGADVRLTISDQLVDFASPTIFEEPWRNISLSVRRGMLPINLGNEAEDEKHVLLWSGRLAAAILALLPLEPVEAPEIVSLPEGAKIRVEVNRYERDRRNRAAALAIHGYVCKACDLDMAERYGPVGAGFIEVHHLTPVSSMGPNYLVDPRTDLVPLCPNCHSMAHRRAIPYSVAEIRAMLQRDVRPTTNDVI